MREGFVTSLLEPQILRHHIPEHPKHMLSSNAANSAANLFSSIRRLSLRTNEAVLALDAANSSESILCSKIQRNYTEPNELECFVCLDV